MPNDFTLENSKKASPTKKILFVGLYKSLLTNTGKHFILLRLSKIDWIIITPDNAAEEFDKIKASGKPVVVYALTNSGYEALALDMAKILKKLSEQNAIIVAYEDYYSNGDETDISNILPENQ